MFFILLKPSHAVAGADIYKYVDKDGNITFTNRRISNGQKISLASFSRNAGQSLSRSKHSPSKITSNNERDITRRQILEKELATEEKLFTETQTSLTQIKDNENTGILPEKSVQLKNKLFLHQRNIAALRKELSKL
ncbi:DUF4124 domain-containing protein [Nitrosomonas sp. JL21]|uniref:DUF4124 domain-containing protein n=1 Tax=Nitrosomonas sp. JL21 TaxID=153949 RepID=UPI001F04529A|nr:DUF4124 domain-containing protein [Nitrosomonas sp. JL21]